MKLNKHNKLIYQIIILLNIPFILLYLTLIKNGVNFAINNAFTTISIGFNIFILFILVIQFTNKSKINILALLFSCHVNPSRTFSLFNKRFFICSRCTGILLGLSVSIFFSLLKTNYILYLIMLLPLIIDGSLQYRTRYHSNNILRFITGLLFGISISYFYSVTLVQILRLAIIVKTNL